MMRTADARPLLDAERDRLSHAMEALRRQAGPENSLSRLDAGTYGRCRWCGARLPDERLRAVPAATLCIDHQERVEAAAAALLRQILHDGIEREAAAHIDLLPSDELHFAPPPEDGALHIIGQ